MIVLKQHKKTAIFLVSIFIAAFIIRFIFVISLPPQAMYPDETGYFNIAKNLCNGKGYTNKGIEEREQPFFSGKNLNTKDSFVFVPGPVFVLAFLECTVGHGVKIYRIIQSFITSFLPIFVFFLSIRLFESKKIAYIAAIVTAAYPYYIYISSLFIPQTIFSVLLVLTLYFFVSWLKEGRMIWLIMTGFVNGIGCLFVVPMIFTLIPICLIILYRSGFKAVSLTNLITLIACWAVVAGSYMTYASIKNGQFIMIEKSEGKLLLTYNYPGVSGFDVLSHSIDRNAHAKINRLYEDLKRSSGKESVSLEFLKRIIIEQPLFFIRNCFLRLIALFSPITYTMTTQKISSWANIIGFTIYFPLFLLSIAGLLKMSLHRNWIGLQLCSLLIFFLIPYIIMIGNTRYRLPWDSIIIIFAIYFITDKYSIIFNRIFKRTSKESMEMSR